MRRIKNLGRLFLPLALLAANGCFTTHLVRDRALAHLEFSEAQAQVVEVKGQPGYYALLPLTLAGDVATAPFQIVHFLCTDENHFASASIYNVPIPLP